MEPWLRIAPKPHHGTTVSWTLLGEFLISAH